MKKLTFVFLCTIFSAGIMAQAPVTTERKKAEMKDLKKDVVEKREEKKEVRSDLAHAKFKKAVNDHKDVKAENREIAKDSKRLKRHGVKHPIYKAKHKIRAEKEEKKASIN